MIRILIVDDSLTERVRIAGICRRIAECCTSEAENGRAALVSLEEDLPDVILTDIQMPEMNGLQLLKVISEEYPHLPVILMTAEGSENTAAEALRHGAASYVPKAQIADNLLPTLNQVLRTARVVHSQFRLMHYLADSKSQFVLPCDPSLIRACIDQLLNVLRCLPLGSESERLRVGIALGECLHNACFHGNLELDTDDPDFETLKRQRRRELPWASRRITVTAEINRIRARFIIEDEGPGFDWRLAASEESSIASSQGRGLRLMKSIMDDVSFNEAGNTVTLIKEAILPPEAEAMETQKMTVLKPD